MRKARKTSSGKLLIIGVVLAVLAYVFASSTANFNPASLLAAVSGTATTTAPLKVTAPNGGETWAKGSTQTIKWTGGASTWKLEVLLKNASTTNTVVTIATSTANTGSISWKVPTTIKSRTYNIRIRCTNCPTGTKGVTDLSDKPFTISEVAAQPDLTATSVLPTTATVGVPVRFIATTSNIGNASTGSGFNVAFQRATSTAGSGAVVIGTASTTALAAGSARQVPLTYTFSTAGTYYVRACADPAGWVVTSNGFSLSSNAISESNENNNCGPYTAVMIVPVATTTPFVVESSGKPTIEVRPGDPDNFTANIPFLVTATNNDVWIARSVVLSSTSTAGRLSWGLASGSGVSLIYPTGVLTSSTNIEGDSTTGFMVTANSSRNFILTVTGAPTQTGYVGIALTGIGYDTDALVDANSRTYSTGLSVFKTPLVYVTNWP